MPNAMVLHGLHAPVQGWTPRAQAGAIFINGCFLWLNAEEPENAAMYPNAVHLVRLDTPTVNEAPGAYMVRVLDRVRTWLGSSVWRDPNKPMTPPYPIFVVGNEPEQQAADVPEPWNVDTWITAAPRYMQALRQQWPGIVLASAALRVENTHLVTEAYYEQADVKTAHAYWQVREDITNPNLGGAWHWAAMIRPDLPLFITEVNSVDTLPPDPQGLSWHKGTRVDEVIEWVGTLDEQVNGYCWYLADGEGATNLREKSFDVSPDDCRVLMLGVNAPEPVPAPLPPPAPPPPPPEVDYRPGDYRTAWDLSLQQYFDIVDDGSMDGHTSPFRTEAAYHDLMGIARDGEPFDPRLPLAFTKAEGNNGTNSASTNLYNVNNYGGIEWVGQPWGVDSGIRFPESEQTEPGHVRTYAAFVTFGNYIREWERIMHNSIIGPSWDSGDLTGVVEHYTNGPGTGHNKVAFYMDYAARFPPTAIDPNAVGAIVTRADFLNMVQSQDGQIRSGTFDTRNGDHYWCNPATGDFWCQSLMERAGEHLGLTVAPYDTAADAGRAMAARGKLNSVDPPPLGSIIVLDERFFTGGGHTGVCDTDGGTGMTCTCTPEGVGHRPWGMQTIGYIGHYDFDGVGERKAATDMRVDGHRNDGGTFERQWYGEHWDHKSNKPVAATAKQRPYNPDFGIPGLWRGEFMAGRPLGPAISGEEPTENAGEVIQYFQNGHIVWDNNTQRGFVN